MTYMNKPDLTGRITLDEVLLKAKKNTNEFITQLEQEESGERIETVDSHRNQILADKNNTDRNKNKFIKEIKGGLGHEILTVNGVILRRKNLGFRIKRFFIKLFSKF